MGLDLRSKFFATLACLCHYAPKGRSRMALWFLRFASKGPVTPSIYGPLFQTRWPDATFKFCISGMYGRYFSDFLRDFAYPYSFIDIGANIGLYSLVAASAPNCRKCYAFEPNPPIFDSLRQNIAFNNATSVEAYNLAISDREGELHFSSVDVHSGVGRIVADPDSSTITVKAVDRAIFEAIGTADPGPKIVKIDVEGHEPIVIEQLMQSSIWPDIRYLYFEANYERYDVSGLIETLEAGGMKKLCQIDQAGDINLMFEQARDSR